MAKTANQKMNLRIMRLQSFLGTFRNCVTDFMRNAAHGKSLRGTMVINAVEMLFVPSFRFSSDAAYREGTTNATAVAMRGEKN
jgi:hypothetical protein